MLPFDVWCAAGLNENSSSTRVNNLSGRANFALTALQLRRHLIGTTPSDHVCRNNPISVTREARRAVGRELR